MNFPEMIVSRASKFGESSDKVVIIAFSCLPHDYSMDYWVKGCFFMTQ